MTSLLRAVSVNAAGLLITLTVVLSGCSNSTPESATTAVSHADGTGAQTASGSADASTPIPVTLRLNWFPEAEHGGYYAALVHGFYAEQGLDVEIRKGGPGVPVREEVGLKRVDFGISNADQILVARAAGADLVAVLAPLQTSPRCIMVHRESGIERFDQLQNLTIALNENSAFGTWLKQRVPLTGCRFVPYKGSLARFGVEQDFAQQAYVFSEPFVARKNGSDPVTLMAADIGFNPYTSVLITHRDTLRNRSDVVRRFVTAARQGWEKYLAEPEPTNEYIHSRNPEMDLDILRFGVEQLQPLCAVSDGSPIGSMTLARWTEISRLLVDAGLIAPNDADPAAAFQTIPASPPASPTPSSTGDSDTKQ